MTETSLAIALNPPDSASVKVGAAGVLIPNLEGKVVDPLTGTELGVHERGELLVRGPNIMRGYLKNPDATKITIEPDELIPGRRASRARVIAAGLRDDDIDRLIKQAQREVEPRLG